MKDFDVIHVNINDTSVFYKGNRIHFYLEILSSLGRKLAFIFLLISIVFLIIGYFIGGILTGINQQFNINLIYVHKEYIYSIVYGALFYTALVTLVSIDIFTDHRLTFVERKSTINHTRVVLIKRRTESR